MNPSPTPANALPQQLWQVALTYLRRWPIFLFALAFSSFPLVIFYTLGRNDRIVEQFCWSFSTLIAVSILTMFIVLHLRLQLDNARSALTPSFRLPHLAVAAIFLVALNVDASALLYEHIALNFSLLAILANNVALSAILAWTLYEPVPIAGLIGLWCMFIPTRNQNDDLYDLIQRNSALALPLILIAIPAFALLFFAFSRLNGEGSAKSTSNIDFRLRPRNTAFVNFRVGPVTALFCRLFLFLQAQIETLLRARGIDNPSPTPAPNSTLARIHLRRRTSFGGISPTLAGFLCVFLPFLILLIVKCLSDQDPDYHDASNLLYIFPTLVLVASAGTIWPRQWLFLPAESLLPTTRTQLIRELGLAFAVDLLLFWFVATITVMLGVLILTPHQFFANPSIIALEALLSAATLPFIFGITVWTMCFRNGFISSVAVIVTIFASMIALLAPFDNNTHPNPSLILLITLALLIPGLLLTTHAYTRWLRIELA